MESRSGQDCDYDEINRMGKRKKLNPATCALLGLSFLFVAWHKKNTVRCLICIFGWVQIELTYPGSLYF